MGTGRSHPLILLQANYRLDSNAASGARPRIQPISPHASRVKWNASTAVITANAGNTTKWGVKQSGPTRRQHRAPTGRGVPAPRLQAQKTQSRFRQKLLRPFHIVAESKPALQNIWGGKASASHKMRVWDAPKDAQPEQIQALSLEHLPRAAAAQKPPWDHSARSTFPDACGPQHAAEGDGQQYSGER